MNRRHLLRAMAAWAGGHSLRWSPAWAQPAKTYRVVIRMPGTAKDQRDFGWVMSERLGEQLARFGYVPGRNLELVDQYLGDESEPTRAHLDEIRKRKTDVVVSVNVPGTLALRRQLTDIPIVAWAIEDPVASGLAESFTRPGGNVTGLTQGKEGVFARQVDFLAKAIPGLTGIAVFGRRDGATPQEIVRQYALLDDAIRARAFSVVAINTVGPGALDSLPILRSRGAQAAIYFNNPAPLGRGVQRRHAEAAITHRIAAIGYFANLADDGFLASYGELDADLFRRLALQVDRVLRGGNPATMPFMGPQRFHLRINRRTAERLGIALTPEIRLLADEVIE